MPPSPAPSPIPGAGHIAHAAASTLSPTGVFAVLFMALMIDYFSIGPDWLNDRLAFLFGLAAIRVGWNGSGVDTYTVDLISGWIDQAKTTGNTSLAQAVTAQIVGVGVVMLAVYCAGCLMPQRWSRRLGRWALLAFTTAARPPGAAGGKAGGQQLNARLWVCAWLLGMMADLSGGAIGGAVNGLVNGLVKAVAPLPGYLFGVS